MNEPLQQALAGEHAAIYGYGVIGARLAPQQRRIAVAARNAHRSARDQLARLITSAGGAPVAAQDDYVVDVATANQTRLRNDLAGIEDRLCVLYAELVLSSQEDQRRLGIDQMQATAVRATGWRGSAQVFPGLADPTTTPGGTATPTVPPSPPTT
jgi:hypothetical protein